jgi:hypothetical protein
VFPVFVMQLTSVTGMRVAVELCRVGASSRSRSSSTCASHSDRGSVVTVTAST